MEEGGRRDAHLRIKTSPVASHLGGTYFKFSASDVKASNQAQRIDALFDVALKVEKPAVIFLDECDTFISTKATQRVGKIADNWGRFQDGLLVVGATNDPERIGAKLLTGRFERKILVENPNAQARKQLLMKQVAEENMEAMLSAEDYRYIVDATQGRSAVNLVRVISTAATYADGLPLMRMHFEQAMEDERSDYDEQVVAMNRKYDAKFGWRGGSL